VTIEGATTKIVEGVNALRARIISFLSPNIQAIYRNSSIGG
jgi:hypothetical protein